MKRSTLYSIAAVLAVAALFFFMTTARAKVRCRVCMEYRGRTNCAAAVGPTEQAARERSEEHTSELQSRLHLVCRLLLEKKKTSIRQVSCTAYHTGRRARVAM